MRGQQLKSVQEVLNVYGNRKGCEVCKPALSYMLDMLWCGEHEEDRSARFINDRVHANIQKDGTFSVVPRMRGGVTSPAELRRIADVAEKYNVPMVKVTGSQRLDLLGIKKADLPKVWADLGMPSGQAYTKGVRMVKTCVGTEFCRFGVQDSTNAGIELERRLENLFTPHKVKMGVVGCPRNCAEATVKDIGMVGQDGSWQVVVGGAAGKSVRKADLLITVETTEQALEACELFFQYYRENANYLERTYDFVERLGIEKIRKETVYAAEPEKQRLLIAATGNTHRRQYCGRRSRIADPDGLSEPPAAENSRPRRGEDACRQSGPGRRGGGRPATRQSPNACCWSTSTPSTGIARNTSRRVSLKPRSTRRWRRCASGSLGSRRRTRRCGKSSGRAKALSPHPPPLAAVNNPATADQAKYWGWSWVVDVLPYLDQQDLSNAWTLSQPYLYPQYIVGTGTATTTARQ